VGDELAYGAGEAGDAVAELLFGGAGGAGFGAEFLGDLFEALAEAAVGFAELVSHLVDLALGVFDLALGVAPELAVLLVVLAVLFGEAGGNVFDAVEAFLGGHPVMFLWFEGRPACGSG